MVKQLFMAGQLLILIDTYRGQLKIIVFCFWIQWLNILALKGVLYKSFPFRLVRMFPAVYF